MTWRESNSRISNVPYRGHDMERYRSGHNEAVLKTVWGQPHMGSNPILSAYLLFADRIEYLPVGEDRSGSVLGEVPKRLKGHPWKGCRSLIAARGFKSLLLRLVFQMIDYQLLNLD